MTKHRWLCPITFTNHALRKGGDPHQARNTRKMETKIKTVGKADIQLAVSDLLWHRLDDHKRLELYHAWNWNTDTNQMDDCGGNDVSGDFVDSLFAREGRDGGNFPFPCQAPLPKA